MKAFPKKTTTLQTTITPLKPNSTATTTSKFLCKFCNKGSHALRKCYAFKKLNVSGRIRTVNSLEYITNCLSYSHQVSNCNSEGRCDKCKEKHNSLLCTSPKDRNTSTQAQLEITSGQPNNRLTPEDINTYTHNHVICTRTRRP